MVEILLALLSGEARARKDKRVERRLNADCAKVGEGSLSAVSWNFAKLVVLKMP